MNLRELVRQVEDLGIELRLAGERIRYRGQTQPPPELLAELKRHREALMALIARRESLHWPPLREAEPGASRRGPLSLAQRRVWATNFFVDDGTYNLSGGLRLLGRLDAVAFAAAFGDLHDRHPSLRTVFAAHEGVPEQRIEARARAALVARDLSAGLDACLRECQALAAERLPLDETPPLHARLYRLAADDHLFFVVLHHVIADGVSVRVLLDDLARCYSARVAGESLDVPRHDVDMIDYSRFEEECAEVADLGRHRRYWRTVLSGAELGPLPLPPRRGPALMPEAGGSQVLTVDAATTAAVRRLAAATRSTPFLVVAAAIVSMLSRFTGRDDLVVGMPVARRDRRGLAGLVGLLLDMVPIRCDAGGNPSFLELIQRTRAAVLGAVGHAVVPVDLLLGDADRQPRFNVVVTDNGTRLDSPHIRGLEASFVEVPQVGAKFDLNFLLRDDGDTLHLDIEFDRRKLAEDDVAAMVEVCRGILAGGSAHAGARVLDLATPTSSPDATRVPPIANADSLFARIAVAAAERGEAPAVCDDAGTISYRALQRRAEDIARGLRRLEIGMGDVVGLMLPRGIDLVAAVLGVTGCGAAFLAVDSTMPSARAEHVLQAAKCIIAPEADPARRRVTLSQVAELADATPLPAVPASAIAYVMYTSGSTGRPKGVQVAHRSVLSLIDGTQSRFRFDASDTWTLFHSCSFDLSVWEIFGCLITGGRLVVVPQWTTREPEAFVQLLRRERVTALTLTPSALRALLTAATRERIESIRYLILAGEALDGALVERWFHIAGERAQLVNMYGITETTVHSSWCWLAAGPQPPESDIGEALPGVSLHVLHPNGRPVASRGVGEIYVGGAGVAAGYLGQPRETALRFVPDPFAGTPGSRMYRSGDLARLDGRALSYLGRRDTQVQVNGFRVELSEVEAALAAQPGVAAAAAACVEDASGKSIVALVVAGGALLAAEVLRGARAALPRYMVPAALAVVPELPLTDNGKLDRAAVAAAATARTARAEESAAPRSQAEAVLVELFREVLHDTSVSVDSNFFDRGGDSMRAIRLVSLAGDRGLDFGVQEVYANPRLADLAARATPGSRDRRPERAPFSLLGGGALDGLRDAYPMTALQHGMVYHKELAPDAVIYHIVLSYRVGGRMDPGAFRAAAQAVTDRHPVLRTSFDLAHCLGPIQRVHSPVDVPVEFADLRLMSAAAQADEIARLVERELACRFDWNHPALFRLVVLTLSDHDYQLVFAHDHAILDGWSVSIFFEELHAEYHRRLAGAPAAEAPPLRNVFADYVALERRALDEPEHLKFWRARTSAEGGLLAPHRPPAPVMRQVRVELRPGLLAELRAVASAQRVPVKTLLLAAHARILAWVTRRSEVVTGLIVNCRPETAESDRALGLFLNEYPMRLQLGRQSWAELARQLHLDEQAMMPHRFFPFAAIQHDHGARPIFDTYFNFTDFHNTRRLVSVTGLELLGAYEIESTHHALGSNYTVDVRSGELRLILEYDAGALGSATATLVAEAHEHLLAVIVADPHARCLEAPLPDVELAPSAARPPVPAPAPAHHLPTGLEQSVRSVWIEVLGDVDPGLHTSFFDVGGTSLTAMRVVSRLRALHAELSMPSFMSDPTIAAVARSLGANASPPAPASPLPPARDGRHPVTRAQDQLWRLAQQLPGLPLFGMPSALRAEGPLDIGRFERTLAALLERHPALRTRFESSDGGPVQIVEAHAQLDLRRVDLREAADPIAACERSLATAALEPIELTRAPLARAIVYQVAAGLHVIYLNIHHLICDGESMALLLDDLARAYREQQPALPPRLGPGELARQEAEWMRTPAAAAQRRYWRERLAPPWPSLRARADSRFGLRPACGVLERLRAATCRQRIPRTAVERMSSAARRHGLTDFMVLLGAFAATLRAWSGQSDVRIATMMANRTRPERERVVGLLANTVVLRLDVGPDLVELSRQARRVCIEAFDRQELPFEEVLASLNQRAEGLFEAMFFMQEARREVEAGALRLVPYAPDRLPTPPALTTCDFILAATTAGGELVLDLQYAATATEAAFAQALLDDTVAAVGAVTTALEDSV